MLLKTARRVTIAVIGGTVILIGIAMIVLPGPAFIVIPAGLAILATEFAWAGHLLKKLKQQAASITGYGTPRKNVQPSPAKDEPS